MPALEIHQSYPSTANFVLYSIWCKILKFWLGKILINWIINLQGEKFYTIKLWQIAKTLQHCPQQNFTLYAYVTRFAKTRHNGAY